MSVWVCVGSGPSLTADDVEAASERGWRLLAVNRTYETCPAPEIVYGADARFWLRYYDDVVKHCPNAQRWCLDRPELARLDINQAQKIGGAGFSTEHGKVYHGCTSGYQAIQVAYQQGATHIILLGYDMQHTGGEAHFHGDHPEGWPNFAGPERWIDRYNDLAAQSPVPILNCTRESALTQFPRMSIEEAAEAIK